MFPRSSSNQVRSLWGLFLQEQNATKERQLWFKQHVDERKEDYPQDFKRIYILNINSKKENAMN